MALNIRSSRTFAGMTFVCVFHNDSEIVEERHTVPLINQHTTHSISHSTFKTEVTENMSTSEVAITSNETEQSMEGGIKFNVEGTSLAIGLSISIPAVAIIIIGILITCILALVVATKKNRTHTVNREGTGQQDLTSAC